MTVNELIEAVAKKAAELAEMPMDGLRTAYPLETDTPAEIKTYAKRQGWTRGKMIYDILCEEFYFEEDKALPARWDTEQADMTHDP